MKRIALGFVLLLLAGVSMAAKIDYVIKMHRLGAMDAAITCDNGADPTGRKVGEILFISCGEQETHDHELKGQPRN